MSGAWIQTFSQRTFRLDRPDARDVCLGDIAHALASQARFNGHTAWTVERPWPYSVAQHSVLVSRIVEQIVDDFTGDTLPHGVNLPLMGLLHDAHESYVGDVVSPLKARLGANWHNLEEAAELAVAEAFSLPCRPSQLACVRRADRIALVTEARDLLPGGPLGWTFDMAEPLPEKIVPLSPLEAREMFTHRFWELTRGQTDL